MKLVVAGSRNFDNYKICKYILDEIRKNYDITEIVSGTARGADSLGEKYALENNITLKRFPADWNRYGKSAGYKRNVQMATYADATLVFWDGVSRGTKHMIDITKSMNKQVKIIKYTTTTQ